MTLKKIKPYEFKSVPTKHTENSQKSENRIINNWSVKKEKSLLSCMHQTESKSKKPSKPKKERLSNWLRGI